MKSPTDLDDSLNPLIHCEKSDTVYASALYTKGLIQVFYRLKHEPMTEEMSFMFDNALRMPVMALRYIEDLSSDNEG